MERSPNANLPAELCAEIRRRVGIGRVPLKYMNLARGFQIRVDDTSDRLVLMTTSDPTTWEEIGYQEYDPRQPGMRWYLSPSWRKDVTFLLCRLGMYTTEVKTEEVPY